ncbi:MAG: 2-dehydropantoate 2-reductase [candidate division WS1 bacterium]|jgi:2-dehydropantoate 2-reductase|nr:2-dehydropantoate 2-reductase [candidate division WS1 bacterium]
MIPDPRLIVVGPGAMGCLHAALLTGAGFRVALLDHRPERAQLLNRRGIEVTVPGEATRSYSVPTTTDPHSLPPADLLLIFTKAYDLAEALGHASPLISPQTVVLTLQNGLGNYELLAQRVSPARVLAGSTSSGATLTAPGEILVAAIGETLIGSPAGDRALAAEVVEIFQQAHLPASLADNVDTVLWRKVLINAALNPLGALTRRHNGELLALPPLRDLLGRVAAETHAVALALGLPLEDLDPLAAVEEVCQNTAGNQCSMLQDVLAGRRTEIQQINGEIVRRGQAVEANVTLNEALVALVEGLL